MTERRPCADFDEHLAEFALGVTPAEDRAPIVEHVASCRDCERRVFELRRVVDGLMLLAPEQEPPPGFESRVLAALPDATSPPRRRPAAARASAGARSRIAVAAAIAACLGIAIGGIAVSRATQDDRRLGAAYRAQLEEASGDYFLARRLAGENGSGVFFGYQGHPSWALVTLRDLPVPESGEVRVVVEAFDGRTAEGAAQRDTARSDAWSWGGAIPFDLHDTASVRVEDAAGSVLLDAVVHERE